MKKQQKAVIGRLGIYALLGGVAVSVLLPVGFMVLNSFIGRAELLEIYGSGQFTGFSLIPATVTLQNYVEILLLTPDYLIKFWNTMLVVTAIVAGQVVVATLGGYGFAKFQFPGKNILLYMLIVLMLMPYQVTLVPNYIVLDRIGLIGTYWSLILPGVFSVFGVFLLSQVFSSIPGSMLDAARIDGANELQVFTRIVLPNGKMGIAAVVILTFIDQWNMVEQPLVFLKDTAMYPLSIFLSRVNLESLDIAFSCGVLAMLPVSLLLLYLKDALVQGIEYSSLK